MKLKRLYFRQDPRLAYIPEEDVVYDDSFSVDLYTLLTNSSKSLSIPQVREKLDKSGYIGRYKINKVYKGGCYPLNQIRLAIDLIWSGISYVWPYKGVLSLDHMKVEYTQKIKPLPYCTEVVVDGMFYHMSGSPHCVTRDGSVDRRKCDEAVLELKEMGLIRGMDFKIVDPLELEEVKQNLLNLKSI